MIDTEFVKFLEEVKNLRDDIEDFVFEGYELTTEQKIILITNLAWVLECIKADLIEKQRDGE